MSVSVGPLNNNQVGAGRTLAGGGGETLASVLVRNEGLEAVVLRRAPRGRSLAGRRDEHDRNILTLRCLCYCNGSVAKG